MIYLILYLVAKSCVRDNREEFGLCPGGNKRRLNVSLSFICSNFMAIGVKVRLGLGTNVHVFPDFSKTHHKKT